MNGVDGAGAEVIDADLLAKQVIEVQIRLSIGSRVGAP
jgi:hypothetical protein